MTISAYLTFNGNCRQAMTFYQECLGGELLLQTIGDHVQTEDMPRQMKDYILQATLISGQFVLTGSDMVGDDGLLKGNTVSLMLHCGSEQELKRCYRRLSAGGRQTHPVSESIWGDMSGDLTDKFGNQWLLHYQLHTYTNNF